MNENHKSFACDLESGICAEQEGNQEHEVKLATSRKLTIYYYTDPICSACWALEPYLRKLEEAYGTQVTVEYRMGGLLRGWDQFSDRTNGISKPSDVAGHWEEIAERSGMSMDGDVWLEDPLHSSYPPSIAFKAAQLQGRQKAKAFLRRIREMLFLEKINIAREEALLQAADEVGLEPERFVSDLRDSSITERFYQEVEEGRRLGVRGFPSMIVVDEAGQGTLVAGYRSYEYYADVLSKVAKEPLIPSKMGYTAKQLLQKYGFLSTREVEVMLGLSYESALTELRRLERERRVECVPVKFGFFWRDM